MSYQNEFVCSNCGQKCSFDGRCGDTPYLSCKCGSSENVVWVNDGRGGYDVNVLDAKPVHVTEYKKK